MSCNINPLLIALYLVTVATTISIEADDPNRIESHSYEYYQITRSKEVADACETDEMIAYGLSGDAISLSERNEICPHIAQNCCGKKDQARIWEYWHRDRKRQEYYHVPTLLLFKYLLGYGKEWLRISRAIMDDYEDKANGVKNNATAQTTNENDKNNKDNYITRGLTVNANKYCYEAAKFVGRLDFGTKEKAEFYYDSISRRTEFLENARKSFYCMFCSVEGQKAVRTWHLIKSISNIEYDISFCGSIVRNTFQINYELYNTYNLYVTNLLKMSMCVTVNDQGSNGTAQAGSNNANYKSNSPPTALSKEEKAMIGNPLKNDDTWDMGACRHGFAALNYWACVPYCNDFNIAKPSPGLDGDMRALHRVQQKLEKYEKVFISARHNFFKDDLSKMKQTIENHMMKADRMNMFYKTIVQNIDVSRYGVYFLWVYNPVDPMRLARNTPLPINYKSESILRALVIMLVGMLLYRG